MATREALLTEKVLIPVCMPYSEFMEREGVYFDDHFDLSWLGTGQTGAAFGCNGALPSLARDGNPATGWYVTQIEAHVLTPQAAQAVNALVQRQQSAELNYPEAGAAWGVAFASTVGIWLIAKKIGMIISLVKGS
jgi:hypothetical protein